MASSPFNNDIIYTCIIIMSYVFVYRTLMKLWMSPIQSNDARSSRGLFKSTVRIKLMSVHNNDCMIAFVYLLILA